MLVSDPLRKLGRDRIGDYRIIMQLEDDAVYIRRIVDRKEFSRVVDRCDSRVKPTGITIEEFLMKYSKDQAVPETSAPSRPVTTPAELTGNVGDEDQLSPAHHKLIQSLSNFVQDSLCGELATAQQLFREDIEAAKEKISDHGLRIDSIGTKQSSQDEKLDRLSQGHDALTVSQRTLSDAISGLQGQSTAHAESLESAVAGLTSKIDDLRNDTTTSSSKVAESLVTLNAAADCLRIDVDAKLAGTAEVVEQKISTVKAVQDDDRRKVNARIDDLAAQIARDKTTALTERGQLEARFAPLDSALGIVQMAISKAVGDYAELDALVRQTNQGLARQIELLTAENVNLKKIVDTQEVMLRTLRDEVKSLGRIIEGYRWSVRFTSLVNRLPSFVRH
jgi:hypothetical protein